MTTILQSPGVYELDKIPLTTIRNIKDTYFKLCYDFMEHDDNYGLFFSILVPNIMLFDKSINLFSKFEVARN